MIIPILMALMVPVFFLVEIKIMYELLLFLFPLDNSYAGMFSILLSLISAIVIFAFIVVVEEK